MATRLEDIVVPPYETIIASSKDEIQQCFDVRIEVFHHEQKFPLELELDDKEDISTHILLRLIPSLEPIGTIRGYQVPGTTDTYKLSRLALLKEYRQYGLGRKLVEALHNWIKAHASDSVLCTPPAAAAMHQDTDGKTSLTHDSLSTDAPPHQDTKWIQVNCHSQIYAKGFYSKFDYVPEGEEFIEDGDPHQKMVLRIPIPIPRT